MSYTFTKLFSGLTESTVWVEPYATRVLWVSMLSWADQHGRVFGSMPGIARRAGINLDECEAALVSFMSPDRHSRTPDHDGRRIEKIDGGWRLLNYQKYREMRDIETRREQNREAQRRHRERVSQRVSKTADDADNKPQSAQAEAEEEKKLPSSSDDDGFVVFWRAYPRKVGKGAAVKVWPSVKANLPSILEALNWQKKSRQWKREDGQFIPHPATYLRQQRWLDEPEAKETSLPI